VSARQHQQKKQTMLSKIVSIVTFPFTFGYNYIDARPSGATYRKVVRTVKPARETSGLVVLSVGDQVVAELGHEPLEVATKTLAFVGDLRRSQAGAIAKLDRQQRQAENEAADKAQAPEICVSTAPATA
jgi:hypothetical protein